jgi:hypothetical protein
MPYLCVRQPLAGLEDIKALPYVRQALAESLRLYPQPPLLIRRALAPDTLPPGLNGNPEGYPIGAGGWVRGLLKGRRNVGERDGGGGCVEAPVGKSKGGRGDWGGRILAPIGRFDRCCTHPDVGTCASHGVEAAEHHDQISPDLQVGCDCIPA